MNKHLFTLVGAAILGALPLFAQQPQQAPRAASTGGASPHETVGTVIGDRRTGARITITYGRPSSKHPRTGEVRKIWGTAEERALVPYGRAWRLGADEATTLISTQPLAFGDVTVPAGVALTLYMIPEANGPSKLAFSKRIGQWGVPVDETQDLGRVELKKGSLEKPVEQLTIAIERDQANTGGTLKIMWENTQFSVPFTVKK